VAQCWKRDVFAAVGVCCSYILEIDRAGSTLVRPRQASGLTLFFDADLFGLGALDGATGREALIA
jgi:hypothetical protein